MTLNDFYKARIDGPFEGTDITVWLDDTIVPPLQSHLVIETSDIDALDYRMFSGLNVYVYAESYTQPLLDALERFKKTASFILVGLIDFGDELGWTWTKANGEKPV